MFFKSFQVLYVATDASLYESVTDHFDLVSVHICPICAPSFANIFMRIPHIPRLFNNDHHHSTI